MCRACVFTLFTVFPWRVTYGDHLTIQAAADVFNIQIVIYSTPGTLAKQTISPTNNTTTATFYLGHFAEGVGEHYVCAWPINVIAHGYG